MKQISTLFALGLFLFGAFGCGTTDNPINVVNETQIESIKEGAAPGEGLIIGSKAPDFELPDGHGVLHSVSDYIERDKKVLIVFYRGSW